MVFLAVNVLGKKRIGVLYASDDYGQGLFQTAEATVKGMTGVSIVGAETFVPGTTKDFTAQWTKLAGNNPDVILLCGYFNDIGTAVGQMARAGLTQVALVGASGVAEAEYVKLAGSAAEGTYLLNNYDSSNPSQENQRLVRAYRAKFGTNPGVEVAFNYVIPYIFKTAIENGATRSTLGDAVRKVSLRSSAAGAIRFSQYGDNIAVPVVVQVVKNGTITFDADLTQKLLRGSR
jgi:branched-chain amino acid transport system substrate-binding protein